MDWTPTPGAHVLTVVAVDDDGARSIQAQSSFRVNEAPDVEIDDVVALLEQVERLLRRGRNGHIVATQHSPDCYADRAIIVDDEHGGAVSVRNVGNAGARFTLVLPD